MKGRFYMAKKNYTYKESKPTIRKTQLRKDSIISP